MEGDVEMDIPVKDTDQLTNGPKPGMHVWKLPGGGAEMVIRPFAILTLTIAVGGLIASLAANNSGVVLPTTSEITANCSTNIRILGGPYLQFSVNIFAGVFVALTVIGLLVEVMWIVLRYLNIGYINSHWRVIGRIVVVIESLLLAVTAGGVAGSYYLGTLISSHASLYSDSIEADPALNSIRTGIWVAFGGYILSFFQVYQLIIHLTAALDQYGNCRKDSCNRKCGK